VLARTGTSAPHVGATVRHSPDDGSTIASSQLPSRSCWSAANEERTDTDAGWRLIGTTDGSAESGTILHLSHLVDQDPSLAAVLDLRAGAEARRPGIGRRWRRSGERGLLDRMRRRPS